MLSPMVLEETTIGCIDEEKSTAFEVEEFGEFALESVAKCGVLLFTHEKTDYMRKRSKKIVKKLS